MELGWQDLKDIIPVITVVAAGFGSYVGNKVHHGEFKKFVEMKFEHMGDKMKGIVKNQNICSTERKAEERRLDDKIDSVQVDVGFLRGKLNGG